MIERTDPLPRMSLGGESKFDCPVGYMGADGLMEHLLALWWGVDFSSLGIEIKGHQVTVESRLGSAAATGQIIGCARVVQEAGEAGKIRGYFLDDLADPLATNLFDFPRQDWSACNSASKLDLLASDLMTGVVGRIDGQWLFRFC